MINNNLNPHFFSVPPALLFKTIRGKYPFYTKIIFKHANIKNLNLQKLINDLPQFKKDAPFWSEYEKTAFIVLSVLAVLVFYISMGPVDIYANNNEFPIYDSTFSKYYEHDPGTLFMYFVNKSNEDIRIDEVLLNNIPFPNEISECKRCIWYRCLPEVIDPNEVCEVTVKLSSTYDKAMRLGVKLESGKIIQRLFFPINKKFLISSICFSKDLKDVYIYVKNNGRKNQEIISVFHGIRDITALCKIPEREIAPQMILPIHYCPDQNLTEGSFITLKVTARKNSDTRKVKVFSRFPITCERIGKTIPDLSADPENDIDPLTFYCPMHKYGSRMNASDLFFENAKTQCSLGNKINGIWVCRNRIDEGLFLYGQIADVMFVNPHNKAAYYQKKKHPEKHMTEYVARLTKDAASPKPFHTVIVVGRNTPYFGYRLPAPEEVRLQVYYSVINGTKGIMYRGYNKNNQATANEVSRLNHELLALRPFLRIGEPVKWGKNSNKNVEVGTILAGTDTLIVVAINHNNKSPLFDPFSWRPESDITLTIHPPSWFTPKTLIAVDGNEKNKIDFSFENKGRKMEIKIDKLEITKQFIIKGE